MDFKSKMMIRLTIWVALQVLWEALSGNWKDKTKKIILVILGILAIIIQIYTFFQRHFVIFLLIYAGLMFALLDLIMNKKNGISKYGKKEWRRLQFSIITFAIILRF